LLATTVEFSGPGVHTLRLTVSDGDYTSEDDVLITVDGASQTNQPPTVDAGADQTVALPNSAQFAGAVTDDGLPQGSTATFAWSQVSGPIGFKLRRSG
jgi:hypothetical protein